ncbi:MAG: MaoC/PaaZ C-terminal domain-containing protein [Dehalococcoidia bacterium]|jgi:acyl dehydratase
MSWKSIYWDDVGEDDELPTQTREITRTTIVATAIATRDFTPVHHDHEAAQREGATDIFLNILSTGGFIGKYLTDWSGPEGELKKITIRLGATVFPGDILTSGGKIAKKYTDGDKHLVDVDFNFTVPMGPHAWGTATVALPTKG